MEYILTYALYVLVLSVLMGVSTWKLFLKMGYSPLVAFVPFYNYLIILKETKKPKWWVIFAYFPIVGTVMLSVFHLFLMGKFGKRSFGQKTLTVLSPFLSSNFPLIYNFPALNSNTSPATATALFT